MDKSVRWRIDAGRLPLQEQGYRQTTEAILSFGLATEVVGLLSAGKEADVYLARYNGVPIAIKAYRLYQTSRRGGRPNKLDNMSWQAAREYQALYQAWRAGIRVPAPARRVENMLSMRYLGGQEEPAPKLQSIHLSNPEEFLDRTVASVKALFRAGIVHGDLSAFNILVYEAEPWFIDFSDWVQVNRLGWSPWRRATVAKAHLSRGLHALRKYFRRYQLEIEVEAIVSGLMAELQVPSVY